MSARTPGPLMKQAQAPTIDELWDAVERSLDDASKAFPVLLTILKAKDFRSGAEVADEMIAAVKYAAKAMPALRRACNAYDADRALIASLAEVLRDLLDMAQTQLVPAKDCNVPAMLDRLERARAALSRAEKEGA